MASEEAQPPLPPLEVPCWCELGDAERGAAAGAWKNELHLEPCARHHGEDVRELDLSVRGLQRIYPLHTIMNLVSLNLAFNRLTTLPDLSMNAKLEYLNVSHNKLKTLNGLSELEALRVCNASFNKVTRLDSLCPCVSLEELWLNHNKLSSLREVEHFHRLDSLATLFLHDNPFCRTINHSDAVSYVVDMVPAVGAINISGETVTITHSARSVAHKFMRSQAASAVIRELNEAAKELAGDAAIIPLHIVQQKRKAAQSPTRGTVTLNAAALAAHDSDGSPGRASPGRGSAMSVRSARSGKSAGTRASRMSRGSKASTMRSGSNRRLQGSGYVARTKEELAGSTILSAVGALPDLSAKIAARQQPGRQRKQQRAKPAKQRAGARGLPGHSSSAAGGGDSATLPASNPAAGKAEGAVKAKAKAKAVKSKTKPKVAASPAPARAAAAAAPAPSTPERAYGPLRSSAEVVPAPKNEFMARYKGSTSTAVHIRWDGGGTCKWPSGALAVSVDVDSDPADRDTKLYRLFVMAEDGSMVANFDQLGAGQVCTPKGVTLLSANGDGSGFRSDSQGIAVARWDADGVISVEPSKGAKQGDPLRAMPGSAQVMMPVTQGLGIQYDIASREVVVWFSHKGVVHRVCQGFNEAKATTAQPPAALMSVLAPPSARPKRAKRHAKVAPTAAAAAKPAPVGHQQTLADIRAAVSGL